MCRWFFMRLVCRWFYLSLLRVGVFNFQLWKFMSVRSVRPSSSTSCSSMKNFCAKTYTIILYILLLCKSKNLLFRTRHAFSRKLMSIFLCVLDSTSECCRIIFFSYYFFIAEILNATQDL